MQEIWYSLHEGALNLDDGRVQATGAVLFPRVAGLSNKAGGDESLATTNVDDDSKRKIINRYAIPFFHRRTDN